MQRVRTRDKITIVEATDNGCVAAHVPYLARGRRGKSWKRARDTEVWQCVCHEEKKFLC